MKQTFLLFALLLLNNIVTFSQEFISDTTINSKFHNNNIDSNLLINIFQDSANIILITDITFAGNKTTKIPIIKRELLFNIGDTLSIKNLQKKINQSRLNLINTSLFNFVTITYQINFNYHVTVHIEMIERWYLWPFPIFEISDRNFNSWWETKDIDRINYGLFFVKENFRGRKEVLKLFIRMGYDEEYSISYKIPYINKQKTLGIAFATGFAGKKSISYQTKDNRLLNFKDEQHYLRQKTFYFLQFSYRKHINTTHSLLFSYDNFLYQDTILKLNPFFTPNNNRNNRFISIIYKFAHDKRDVKAYPLKGYYFESVLSKHGIGVFNDKDINVTSIAATANKYYTFGNRWYGANGFSGKLSIPGYQPYSLYQALGYGDEFVRGYEYYVIDGQHFILNKNILKFALVPTRINKLPLIPTPKFNTIHWAIYTNIYTDFGYSYENAPFNSGKLVNSLLIGAGAGLDFVTYYDKVLRVEYSINKMMEHGLFLHFFAAL